MPFFGAHKSIAGGYHNALHAATAHACQTVQLFTKPPNQWAGKPITDIFAQEGEAVFRERESRLVEELTHRTRTVISTGGGLPLDPANMASLKSHALVICLWASPEVIWEHVRGQNHRPLLTESDPLEKVRSLLAIREPFYRQADVLVNTEMRSIRDSSDPRGTWTGQT